MFFLQKGYWLINAFVLRPLMPIVALDYRDNDPEQSVDIFAFAFFIKKQLF